MDTVSLKCNPNKVAAEPTVFGLLLYIAISKYIDIKPEQLDIEISRSDIHIKL